MSDLQDRIAGLSPEKRELLMKRLAQVERRAGPPPIPRLPRGAGERYPLSPSQQRLWLLDRLLPGTAAYNVSSAMWAEGAIDSGRLGRALGRVVERHESLRTTFGAVAAEPFQRIHPPAPVALKRVDLDRLPEAAREREALRLARRAAAASFDLERGPLLAVHLLRLAPRRHLLVINVHHIVLDGWSLEVLYRDLAAFYDSELPDLPELPVQYVDFAAFQRQELASPEAAARLDDWRERLADLPPGLELPADRPRPSRPSLRGDCEAIVLGSEVAASLKGLAGRESATPFIVLLAAFGALLSHYTGERDLLVGTPVANRGRPELAGVIGYFVNTLVVRLDLTGNPTFRQLVARVREASLASTAQQDLPVERLIEALHPARDLSRPPLFQVLFSFQSYAAQSYGAGSLSPAAFHLRPVDPDLVNPGVSKFDLSLFLAEENGALAGFFEYSSDLFDAATVRRSVGHLRTLVTAALAAPDTRLDALPLLTEAERRQLDAWNDTAAALPAPATLHGPFFAQAARTPGALALETPERALTYAELASRAGALARRLRQRGVGRGELVGVFLERSPEMVAALLAILDTGAAYLPLDPAFPAGRLAYMLEDAGVRRVVTEPALAGELPFGIQAIVISAEEGDEPAPESETSTPPEPLDRAYVIYTSGSTGRPKGVEIPHHAAANFLAAMACEPGLAAGSRLCAVTTLSFDIAVLELFLPLAVGGTIVLADRATATDGARLGRRLAESRVDVTQATPATWRLLLAAGWEPRRGPEDGPFRVLCGGEALPVDLAAALVARGCELWNVYGPTETTVWSTIQRVTPAAVESGRITVGRPIANTTVHLLDRGGRRLPVGVPGELLIGGLGLARGYLGRPALTAERFVPDSLGQLKGERLYRTGDLARWRADGELEVLGRIDHQVKVRGYRIELGEIEAALLRDAEVAQAVVAAREDLAGDPRLVAYLVAAPGRAPRAAGLRESLRQSLPDYMVPSVFVFLDELPRTPNGKVDRRALPAPEAEAAPDRVLPSTPAEEQLAGLWRAVLHLPAVGIHESFFDLGGHSLLGAQLLARVEQEFGVELPLRALFDAPTLSELLDEIVRHQAAAFGGDALSDLLADLESLDETELQALLAAEGRR